jgi:hypothetical protein
MPTVVPTAALADISVQMGRNNGARDPRKGRSMGRTFYPALPLLGWFVMHDAEHTGAAMNILDDLRAEWIAIRKSLGDHIAYLEAGNRIHPIGQDPDEVTTEFLVRLKQYRSEVQGWLVHLPSESE